MKPTDLLRFIIDNTIEYHWINDNKDVIIFVYMYQLDDFYKLLTSGIFEDEGLICHMKDGYFCFEMLNICSYYDIELVDIFKKD